MVGSPVAADYQGLPVLGSYGQALLIESSFIPSGYVCVASTNGPNSTQNALGFRDTKTRRIAVCFYCPDKARTRWLIRRTCVVSALAFGIGLPPSVFRSRPTRLTPNRPTA